MSVIERERRSLAVHRATLRGNSVLPPPRESDPTFLHGFFLPFTLIAATLRDPQLRGPYLRVTVARTVVLALVAGLGLANGGAHGARDQARHARDRDPQGEAPGARGRRGAQERPRPRPRARA